MEKKKTSQKSAVVSCVIETDDSVESEINYSSGNSKLNGVSKIGIAFESSYESDGKTFPKTVFVAIDKDDGIITTNEIKDIFNPVFENATLNGSPVTKENIYSSGFVCFRPFFIKENGEELILDPEVKVDFQEGSIISVTTNDAGEIITGIMDKEGLDYQINLTGNVDMDSVLDSQPYGVSGYRTPVETDVYFSSSDLSTLKGSAVTEDVHLFNDQPFDARKGWTPLGMFTGSIDGAWTDGKEEREGYTFEVPTQPDGKLGINLEVNGGDSMKVISNFKSILGAPWRELADNTLKGGFGNQVTKYWNLRSGIGGGWGGAYIGNILYSGYGNGLVKWCHNLVLKNVDFQDVEVISPAKAPSIIANKLSGHASIENVKISGKSLIQGVEQHDSGGIFGDISSTGTIDLKNVELDLFVRSNRYGSGMIGGVIRNSLEEQVTNRVHSFENVKIDGYLYHGYFPSWEFTNPWGGGWHGCAAASAFIGSVGIGNTMHLKDVELNADYSYYRGDYGSQSGLLFSSFVGSREKPNLLTIDNVKLTGKGLKDHDNSDGGRISCCRPPSTPLPGKTLAESIECFPNNPNGELNPSNIDNPSTTQVNRGVYPYDPLVATESEQLDRNPGYLTNYCTAEAYEAEGCRRTCALDNSAVIGALSWTVVAIGSESGRGLYLDGVQHKAIDTLYWGAIAGAYGRELFLNNAHTSPLYPTEWYAKRASFSGTATQVSIDGCQTPMWIPTQTVFKSFSSEERLNINNAFSGQEFLAAYETADLALEFYSSATETEEVRNSSGTLMGYAPKGLVHGVMRNIAIACSPVKIMEVPADQLKTLTIQ